MTSSVWTDRIACEMIKELFRKQKQALDHFFEGIDHTQCEHLLQLILEKKGVIFFTGVGKSGYIAQKIAATMMSTGTKALFLSPIDALHGDLGMVSKHDLLLAFSKSGETEELLHLLPSLRNKGCLVYAVTSEPYSRLAKGANFSLVLPCISELCPFDLAPTTSTEVQLLFGDVLSIALMEAKKITLEAFAENHPAGRIGKRATVRVKDLMLERKKTPICLETSELKNALAELSDKRCGCLIVIDDHWKLKGIFTDGDLRRALQNKGEHVLDEKLGDLMTSKPRVIDVDALAWDAMKLMEIDIHHPIMVLPVVGKDREVVGIVKMHDLIQAGL